ncbi:MAG: bifunctional acetate--CoA ligase family protein/GNAT family N-acetyltransferase [Cellvibrionaceae bacterium]|nr:bifunctional acetate--CoA ligase family protein/GNAT family N-acetyltransferase [Cellvibrionaceae bacterium]
MSDNHYLSGLFNPKSVAVVGASTRQNSLGAQILNQLFNDEYAGDCFYVNPKYSKLKGKTCYKSVLGLPQRVDLAIVVTPPSTWSKILTQCANHHIRFAIILSNSTQFNHRQIEAQKVHWQQFARAVNIRLLGPHSLGLIRPHLNFNASLMPSLLRRGKLALVSQSGALCSAMLDWAKGRDIGFSTVLATGGSADIDFAEALDFLAADPETQAILVYVEGIDRARLFMSSLRSAARIKPVTVVKSGRHKMLRNTQSVSHTGSLVGRDEVFDAALRRAGVIRGSNLGDLFYVASVLARGQRLKRGDFAIISNGAGPGIMAADKARDLALPLARFSEATIDGLRALGLQLSNPLDLEATANTERYRQVLHLLLQDTNVASVLVLLAPRSPIDPSAVSQAVVDLAATSRKPVVACWMGDNTVQRGRSIFYQAAVPSFRLPENAVQAIAYLADFRRNQQLLLQTPGPSSDTYTADLPAAKQLIKQVLKESRSLLTEVESKQLLAAFRIPVVSTRIAYSADEARKIAEDIGFPVVLKVYSKHLTHKSDVDGVRLDIRSPQQVVDVFDAIISAANAHAPGKVEGVVVEPMVSFAHGRELLIGIARDPVFGPVISFGFGGVAAELLAETSVGLPPLNPLLADELISRTRAEKLLGAMRKVPPANRNAVVNVLLRVSEIACELPAIKEMDINPLLVDENQAIVLDARIVVDQQWVDGPAYSHTAIHPYPSHVKYHERFADGRDYVIRPIRPEDADIERRFVDNLSEQAKYFRFMHVFKEITPEMLARFTLIDYEREMALVAVVGEAAQQEIIGVCRYITNHDLNSCDFGVVVGDQWQRRGLANKLMQVLIDYAMRRGLQRMEGDVLADNRGMLLLCSSLGFNIETNAEDPSLMKVIKTLQ